MRWLIPLLPLAMVACAAGEGIGEASYDALSRARASCVARGGELKLRDQGNPRRLDAYYCDLKK